MFLSLDHLGVVSAARNELRALFGRLGFDVTQPDELLSSDAGGVRRPLGQSSSHLVMSHGYVELSEVYSTDPAHHLASYLRRGPGLHILALGSENIAAERGRCQSAGLSCSELRWASRDISYGERHGAARFEWFMLAPQDAPDGLVCIVRNDTPELVYQSQVMQHPNGAVALRGLVVACRDVDAAAARYARISGATVETAGADRCLSLDGDVILLRPAAKAIDLHGGPALDGADRFAAMIIAVRDMGAAANCLRRQGIATHSAANEIRIRAEDASGAGVVLVPA